MMRKKKDKLYLKKWLNKLNIVLLIFLFQSTAYLPIVSAVEDESVSTEDSETSASESVESSSSEETSENNTSSTSTTSSSTKEESSTTTTSSGTTETTTSKEKDKTEKDEPEIYEYVVTKTTQDFISLIGEDARKIAADNDLYASIMIAQAILESGSGNSKLARQPNYNLFGIKGSYRGESVSMDTLEDDGGGKFFSIVASFRKYPGYKESLEDYAALLAGKNKDLSSTFYYGARKTYAKTYKDATKFLTGKYATDTHYDKKLNGLIETYDLTQFDFPNAEAQAQHEKERQEAMIRRIDNGDTLWDIAKENDIDLPILVKSNRLSDSLVREGQEILIPSKDEVVEDEVELDDLSANLDKVSTTENVQSAALKVGQRVTTLLKKELDKSMK